MKRLITVLFSVLAVCLTANAQFSELKTIEIGMYCTTHVLFTSDLTYVDISKSDVIAAKVVDASKNMLALKAKDVFDYTTTISALEANGTMHTFKVRFNPYPDNLIIDTRAKMESAPSGAVVNTQSVPEVNESSVPVVPASPSAVNVTSEESSNFGKADAPTIDEIIKLPQQIYHVGDRNFKLEAYCTNIFVYSDQLYIILTLFNNSDIGFEAGDAQFAIETLSRKQKALSTDKDIWAKSSVGSLSCGPKGQTMVGYTLPKFTLLKGECLVIYIYEKKGNRNLILKLSDKDINYAVSPR